jgi:dipeptidyl aminopeptidase/acylaminoacyl peptidase
VSADRSAVAGRRSFAPDDVYRFRVPTEPRLSPDGRLVAFTVQTVAPRRDGYRRAIWLVPSDGSAAPRQLTIGARSDRSPRFSPDGRTLAFLSDRRPLIEEEPGRPDAKGREDVVQVYLLPLGGGEARRLTDLPRGVDRFEWAPDGSQIALLSSSAAPTFDEDAQRRGRRRPLPEDPPESDYHFLDRLRFMENGAGFTYHKVAQLWVVDVASGRARRLTAGRAAVNTPAWSPDGRLVAFAADRGPIRDLRFGSDLWVIEVATGNETRIASGGYFDIPTWLPDNATIAALGTRFPVGGGSRFDLWLFAADGSESGRNQGRNLSGEHDLMPGSTMNSDLTPGEEPRLFCTADGSHLYFTAPTRGAFELWRLALATGGGPVSSGQTLVERVTKGNHYISGWDARSAKPGSVRIAFLRSTPTTPADLFVLDVAQGRGARRANMRAQSIETSRRLTELNAEVLAEIELVEPEECWSSVDGRDIQGWYIAPRPADGNGARVAPTRPAPLVLEIHGGPHTLYGWSPILEFQVLAAAGIGVYNANPRGSEGYGQAFNAANFRDWGDGPMRDVMVGVDALIDEGRADPDRLGVTGGSYGGYLTSWIVGHTTRFRAAITCRSVNDLTSQMSTGDLAGPEFGRMELGAAPWEDVDLYRDQSPITYAQDMRTPLLIQHSEKDLRTPIGQAEQLFTVLRSLRRPVRMMRVPEETHELTRSGTPFRRVENLVQVRAWFTHFLVDGRHGLPPIPKVHGGR